MSAPRKLPDRLTLSILRDKGWRLADIAEEYGVSEVAVWKALNKGDLTRTYNYRQYLPWEVEKKHQSSAVMVNFRSIIRQRNGQHLDEVSERRLSRWLQELEDSDVVVAYHPDCPPNPASSVGGFYYVKRRPSDRWIVRQPGETDSSGSKDPIEPAV